jgi:hypothetical protein
MSAVKGRRARRLAGSPVPAAIAVLARGDALSMSRPELEPVVTEMVLAWWNPSLSKQTLRACPGIVKVLDWLQDQAGNDWHSRWVASGADSQPRTWPSLTGATTITEAQAAGLTVEALVILRAIAPSLLWLLGVSRFRLQDHWTLHHDAAVFAALRKRLNADDCVDRGDTIGHLYRLSVTTGRDLPALTAADFYAGHCDLVRAGRRRNLDAAWRHLRQVGLLSGEPEELCQVRAKPRLTPAELIDRYGCMTSACGGYWSNISLNAKPLAITQP